MSGRFKGHTCRGPGPTASSSTASTRIVKYRADEGPQGSLWLWLVWFVPSALFLRPPNAGLGGRSGLNPGTHLLLLTRGGRLCRAFQGAPRGGGSSLPAAQTPAAPPAPGPEAGQQAACPRGHGPAWGSGSLRPAGARSRGEVRCLPFIPVSGLRRPDPVTSPGPWVSLKNTLLSVSLRCRRFTWMMACRPSSRSEAPSRCFGSSQGYR